VSKRRADVEVDSPSQVSPDPKVIETTIVEPGPQDVAIRVDNGLVNMGDLGQAIKNILHDELGHMISDVERRLSMAYEVEAGGRRTVHAPDLNVARHYIEGYTVTANSPGAGSIAWTSVNIVYNGVNYSLTNGNTALKYTWFAMATPTVLQSSNTQPVLATGDTLVFVNNSGVPTSVLEGSGGIAPAVGPASVNTSAIVAGAVGDTQISGVTAAKLSGVLATGNIPSLDAAKITSGAFATAQIPSLDAAKITSGSFATAQIPALPASQITSGTFGTAQIPSLDAAKITSGQFADARIADLAATKITGTIVDAQIGGVGAAKVSGVLATGNIPSLDAAKITTGAFGAAQIGAGAITPVKLNTLQHVLY
jgi:hypothetical protein